MGHFGNTYEVHTEKTSLLSLENNIVNPIASSIMTLNWSKVIRSLT